MKLGSHCILGYFLLCFPFAFKLVQFSSCWWLPLHVQPAILLAFQQCCVTVTHSVSWQGRIFWSRCIVGNQCLVKQLCDVLFVIAQILRSQFNLSTAGVESRSQLHSRPLIYCTWAYMLSVAGCYSLLSRFALLKLLFPLPTTAMQKTHSGFPGGIFISCCMDFWVWRGSQLLPLPLHANISW